MEGVSQAADSKEDRGDEIIWTVDLLQVTSGMSCTSYTSAYTARLAQSVEHETLNLGVVGSSPTLGGMLLRLMQHI